MDGKFSALEKWLKQIACNPVRHHRAVAFALREFYTGRFHTSEELADTLGLSQRCFIELFHNEVGITPKRFSRLLRFRRILTALQKDITADWARLGGIAWLF
jgi:methylphosphotriester-DNA--protein-cysteine methyltransferase